MVRDNKGRFKKGESGNKNGRPKGDIIALIDRCVTEQDWIDIIEAQKKLAKRGVLKSAEWLADRKFGKPAQPVTGADGGALNIIITERKHDGSKD